MARIVILRNGSELSNRIGLTYREPASKRQETGLRLAGLENFTAIEQHLYEYVDNQVGTRPLDAQTDNQATTALESYVESVRRCKDMTWTLLHTIDILLALSLVLVLLCLACAKTQLTLLTAKGGYKSRGAASQAW